MSQPCLRCGFPNDAKALHCRACSAPLQEEGAETAIKPRLRQILAETRARTRARQRRGAAVDPNRVDVVPRIPSGVAVSETALKTAIEKGRQARLQGLREELRKGRPEASPPQRNSIPPQEPGATLPPSAEELAASESATQAAKEKALAEQAAARAATERAVAEQAAARAATEKAEVEQAAARVATKKAEARQSAARAATAKAADEQVAAKAAAARAAIEQAAARVVAEAAAATYLEADAVRVNPVKVIVGPEVLVGDAEASTPQEPRAALPLTKEPVEAALQVAEVDENSASAAANETADSPRPPRAPALRGAVRQALAALHAAAARMRVEAVVTETEPKEMRCTLFDGRRLLAALIDSAPALIIASLWLGTQLGGGRLPPEEGIASWLLGEADGMPIGLVVSCFTWLVWSWGGIALWRVSPGMKAMGLSWSDAPIWRVYARPPLFLISLLPLGLGGTYALIDSNSRGLSDLLLRLRWLRR
jgi:hypothetical protein